MSGPALAAQFRVSQSHLSRVELGDAVAAADLVDQWTRKTGASKADRDAATALAEAVAAEFVSWREALVNGLVKLQRDALAAEAAAARMLTYVPAPIPGLLQTPEYATYLVTGDCPDRDDIATSPDGSWCEVSQHLDNGTRQVWESGPTPLWHAVENAHNLWHKLGLPSRDRFGLTATNERQWVWLDSPDSDHTWPLQPVR